MTGRRPIEPAKVPGSRKALVTGGCGFVGRHLVARLIERGDEVRVLDIADPDGLPGAATFLRGSITNPDAVHAAIDGSEIVYHVAGIAHLWRPNKADFDLINRKGVETVMQAAAAHGVGRVVHISTESILLPKDGAEDGKVDESVAPALRDMVGPYTRSKFLGEEVAHAAAREGLDVVIVNPTIPIGPGDDNMTPPAAMIALFLEGRSPFYLDCILNLVDVRDLANGIVLAAEHGRRGERYILGGENVSLSELLERLNEMTGKPMPKRSIPPQIALAAGAVAEWIADRATGRSPSATREGVRIAMRSAPFDSSKARRELGYAPRPITDALADTIAWLTAGERAAGCAPCDTARASLF